MADDRKCPSGQGQTLKHEACAAAIGPILNQTREDEFAGAPSNPSNKEIKKMKIAIPLADGRLCMHFGHCETFALVEVDQATKTITQTTHLTPPAHEPGVLPRWLHEQGADVIIAGGMGQRAQGLFSQNGIDVVVGAPADAPETIVSAYLAGTLEAGQNVCDH